MDEPNKWRADLGHADVEVRARAAEQLCLAGPDSAVAAVELVKACGDEPTVQTWSVAALEDLGPPPIDAVDRLIDLLSSEDSLVVYWSATLLGRIGPQATSAQSALAHVLTSAPDKSAQQRAAWALEKIGVTADSAITSLKQAASSSDPRLARLATSALASCITHEENGIHRG